MSALTNLRRLPNPRQDDMRNAIVNFQANIDRQDWRFRGNTESTLNTQSGTQTNGHLAVAEFHPMNVQRQGATRILPTSGAIPTGDNANDADGVDLTYPGDNTPFGVTKYAAMYGRGIVKKANYSWTIENRENFDIIVGCTLNAHSAFLNKTDSVAGTDLGSPLASNWTPHDSQNINYLKSLPMTKFIRIKAANYGRGGHVAMTAVESAANPHLQAHKNFSNIQPTRGKMELSVDTFSVLNQMTRQLGDSHFDVTKHSFLYSTLGDPTETAMDLFLWVAPASQHVDYQGTTTPDDDRTNWLEMENIGTGTAVDWTARVSFSYQCTQTCILYDPAVSRPSAGAVDLGVA